MNIDENILFQASEALKTDDKSAFLKHLNIIRDQAFPGDLINDIYPLLFKIAVKHEAPVCSRYLLNKLTVFEGKETENAFEHMFSAKDYDLIESFLERVEKFAEPNIKNLYKGDLLLENAAATGHIEYMKTALRNGVCLSENDTYGNNIILMKAVTNLQPAAALILINHGAEVQDGLHMIAEIADKGNPEKILETAEVILSSGVDYEEHDLLNLLTYLVHNSDIEEELANKIDFACEKWTRRGAYIKLPCIFKESITLEALRREFPRFGETHKTTALHRLASADRFEEVLDVCKKTGEELRLDDLLTPDRYGNRVVDILGARGNLCVLNSFSLWKNKEQHLYTYVESLPPVYRKQVDISYLTHMFKQQKIKQNIKKKHVYRRGF